MKKNQLIKMMSIAGMSLLSLGMLTGCGTQTNNAVASAEETVAPTEETADTANVEETQDDTAETTASDEVIIMGTNAEFEPFEYRENGTDIVGFDVEIAQKIADKLGKELKIEDMAFDSLILALNSD